jgi:hypothetical protein
VPAMAWYPGQIASNVGVSHTFINNLKKSGW